MFLRVEWFLEWVIKYRQIVIPISPYSEHTQENSQQNDYLEWEFYANNSFEYGRNFFIVFQFNQLIKFRKSSSSYLNIFRTHARKCKLKIFTKID